MTKGRLERFPAGACIGRLGRRHGRGAQAVTDDAQQFPPDRRSVETTRLVDALPALKVAENQAPDKGNAA